MSFRVTSNQGLSKPLTSMWELPPSPGRAKCKPLVKRLRFGGQADTKEDCLFLGKRFIKRVINTIDGQTAVSEPLRRFGNTWQKGSFSFRVVHSTWLPWCCLWFLDGWGRERESVSQVPVCKISYEGRGSKNLEANGATSQNGVALANN